MYALRSASLNDLDDLFDLSQLMLFINLPPDREIIRNKIESSIKAFTNPSKRLWENYYLFVLEDVTAGRIIGASMIHAQHGTEDEPHYYFSVSQENKFSTFMSARHRCRECRGKFRHYFWPVYDIFSRHGAVSGRRIFVVNPFTALTNSLRSWARGHLRSLECFF
jgi:hypothetical protein